MPKDKKAAAAAKKARTAQKAEKKVAQKEKKASKKTGKDSGDAEDTDDEDLDSVLAAYAKQQELYLAVTEAASDPPSARSSATFIGSPSNTNELFVFGGEYYNGATARFFNDLCIYNIRRDLWTLVTSPNTPLPRSGHAWTRGGNAGGVYLFGGEFSSPKQGTFYHYNDFWRLEPASREWTKIEGGGSKERGGGSSSKSGQSAPSARSGHRMTYYKQYIILFGGFQDTSSTTKYLNDLWIYDTASFSWHTPVLPPASARPDARSSFSFLPKDDGAVLFGGYARVKATASVGGGKNAGRKGNKGTTVYEVLKPVVFQGVWHLKITPPAADAAPGTVPTVRWEKRKRPVNAVQPPRAGATMAYHKGRGIQFGGVHDVENSEEGIESEFFNSLSVWNIERNRYFPLALRRPRATAKTKTTQQERGKRGRGKADEEELLENLRQLELREGITSAGDTENGDTNAEAEKDEVEKVEKPVLWELPHPRFNAQLTVQDDVLYIFGGTFEKEDREYTFDEMWSIDLGNLAGCKEIFKRELEDWQGEESEPDSGDEDGDDEEDEEDDESGDDRGENEPSQPSSITSPTSPLESTFDNVSEADTNITEPLIGESALDDDLPHPRPFESLKDFYARTSQQWQDVLLEDLKHGGDPAGKSIKEVRKGAFERAETKWWDCREEIQALEDEQEEAGIGEVVNLADKSKADSSAGIGRRR